MNDYLEKIEKTDKNIKEFMKYRRSLFFRLMNSFRNIKKYDNKNWNNTEVKKYLSEKKKKIIS